MIGEPGSTPHERIGSTGDSAIPVPMAGTWLDAPAGWTDDATAMDGPIFWARLVSSEAARIRRYGRPATVVVVEVLGVKALAELWGADVALECLAKVGATITRQIRSSDAAARIGPAQFGVYLPETNEVDAINFVERTRSAIAATLGRKVETVTVAIGWASPTNGSLDDAIALAEERLVRERRAADRR